jgi:uncharacterized protein related to proFAR isomerase
MTAQKIAEAVEAKHLESAWHEALDGWESGSEATKQQILNELQRLKTEFLEHVVDVDDEQELTVSVALKYIELKSQWQMLNTQINYRVFRGVEVDEAMLYKATLLSTVVEMIGSFLTDEDLQKIMEFLLNPVHSSLELS